MKPKHIAGLALLGGAFVGAYLIFRPKRLPTPEERLGIRIDSVILHPDQRQVIPGARIWTVVAWTNIGTQPVAPRFRLPIWNGTTPIGDKDEDWQRCPADGAVAPGESFECEVGYNVPTNWASDWTVSARLDIEGVGAYQKWESWFDIVTPAPVTDVHYSEPLLVPPCGGELHPGDWITGTVILTNTNVEAAASVELRMVIWSRGFSTPIGDEDGWVATGEIPPGGSVDLSVRYQVPPNWLPGQPVGVRIDMRGIPDPIMQTGDTCYMLLAVPLPEEIMEILSIRIESQYYEPFEVVPCPAEAIPVYNRETVKALIRWRNNLSARREMRFKFYVHGWHFVDWVTSGADAGQEAEVMLETQIQRWSPRTLGATILLEEEGNAIWICPQVFRIVPEPTWEEIETTLI